MSQRGHWEGTMNAEPLTSAELEVIRNLFFRGLTWDGYLPSKECCIHFVIAASHNINLVSRG
jgi:hypothetical protein